jgi:hypothetical protein
MKVKGKLARDTKETSNLRAYLLDRHPALHKLIREVATANERSFNQEVTYILRKWATASPAVIDDAIVATDRWLDGMVSPDEGDSDVTIG